MILDASTTIAWLFADERDERAVAALRQVQNEGALVPSLWWWEVANVILSAERRKRISVAEADGMVEDLMGLPIHTDTKGGGFGSEFALARRFRLTAYDAAYLELALRANKPLLTRDAALKAAAEELGLVVR